MIRFYKNNLPVNGDIVVASLKQLEEDNNHRCSLLEYGGIEGVICKVSIKKRDKTFKKLKEGSIFLIVVSNVYEKKCENEITTIDLHYMEIDESLIKTHMSRFQQFTSIINAFTYIVADKTETSESKPCVTFNYADQDENIKAKVNIILEESLYNYSKEDVEQLFFKDTIELHNVANNWIECNKIPNFMEKLIIRFPKQLININIVLHYQSLHCNGISSIKHFYKQLNDTICDYDKDTTVEIYIQSMPECNVIIKSPNITSKNSIHYYELIKIFCKNNNSKIIKNNLMLAE